MGQDWRLTLLLCWNRSDWHLPLKSAPSVTYILTYKAPQYEYFLFYSEQVLWPVSCSYIWPRTSCWVLLVYSKHIDLKNHIPVTVLWPLSLAEPQEWSSWGPGPPSKWPLAPPQVTNKKTWCTVSVPKSELLFWGIWSFKLFQDLCYLSPSLMEHNYKHKFSEGQIIKAKFSYGMIYKCSHWHFVSHIGRWSS